VWSSSLSDSEELISPDTAISQVLSKVPSGEAQVGTWLFYGLS